MHTVIRYSKNHKHPLLSDWQRSKKQTKSRRIGMKWKNSNFNISDRHGQRAYGKWELSIQFTYLFISHTGRMLLNIKCWLKLVHRIQCCGRWRLFSFDNNHPWNIIIVKTNSIIPKYWFFALSVFFTFNAIQSGCVDYLGFSATTGLPATTALHCQLCFGFFQIWIHWTLVTAFISTSLSFSTPST